MTCRALLSLVVVLSACTDMDDDDDDTFTDTGVVDVDTDTDLDTSIDARLCRRANRGAITSYDAGRTVDEAPIIDLVDQVASINNPPRGGFVGFEPEHAGGFTFGRSLAGRLQVIDLFGRQPPFVEDVTDTGCAEIPVRSTYILEQEQYWLLIDAGVSFYDLVGEPVPDATVDD